MGFNDFGLRVPGFDLEQEEPGTMNPEPETRNPMIYRHFRIQCVLRVVLLAATMVPAVYLFINTTSYVAAAIITLVAVYQVGALIRYVEKTNHDLSRLLRSIRYSDFSQSFTGEGRGKAFAELGASFREVMTDFRATRAEKEESYRYLQTVMQHVGVGLLSFKQDGTVNLINTAAKRLLRVPFLKTVYALDGVSPTLVETLFRLRSGDKALVKVVDGDELLQLVVYATEFKLRDDRYTLVSIQNIQSELEEMEIEAWQKLTRVLTHEIMNSVAPIASLASTANDLLDEAAMPLASNGTAEEWAETINDVHGALQTIEKRSEGLLHFVNAYRRLTRVPRPDFKIFLIADLFDTIADLMEPQMQRRGIRFERSIQPDKLELTADLEQIEQVLINLVKNAMQAVSGTDDACVRLHARIDERGRAVIQVIDNGPGIVEEAMEKIFIPFFTTKKEGSGIGLSLSREIMRQHGGAISAVSYPNERTVFTLRF
jgi:nitrogen fixation/metabolism regulation signal transduction histidine kinase